MAIIEKRTRSDGTPTWRVRYFHQGRRESETFITEAAAKSFRIHAEAAGGRPVGWTPGYGWESDHAAVPTLTAWAHQCIANRANANDGTRANYRRQWDRHIDPTLGGIRVDQLTPQRVKQWATKVRANVAPKTAWNLHGLLSSVLADAIAEGWLVTNPARGVMPSPGHPATEMVFLTHAEFATLLRRFPDREQSLVQLLAATGLRFSEATALRVRDVDGSTLHIVRAWKRQAHGFAIGEPKTRRSRRSITITDDLAQTLATLTAGRDGDALLFTSPRGAAIRQSHWYDRVWRPVVDNAGLPRRPRIHDLRHTHAAWLLSAGVPVIAVQRRLGHESITTTADRYGHLLPEVDAQILGAVQSALTVSGMPDQTDAAGASAIDGTPK